MNVSKAGVGLLAVLICASTADINWPTLWKFGKAVTSRILLAACFEIKSLSTSFAANKFGFDLLAIASLISEVFLWMVRYSGIMFHEPVGEKLSCAVTAMVALFLGQSKLQLLN